MIKFTRHHLEISLPIAYALLAFCPRASEEYRTTLGVGIEADALSASDARTGLRFILPTPAPTKHQRKVWSRSMLQDAIKAARDAKLATVKLRYRDVNKVRTNYPVRFADLAAVMNHEPDGTPHLIPSNPPEQSPYCDGYGYDARLLARLAPVQRACSGVRATVIQMRGECDPLMFQVKGKNHTAHVAIMPRVTER